MGRHMNYLRPRPLPASAPMLPALPLLGAPPLPARPGTCPPPPLPALFGELPKAPCW
jgi:hypothetical protein